MKSPCTPHVRFRLLSALALVAACATVTAASMDARIVAKSDAVSFQSTMYGSLDVLEAAVRASVPPLSKSISAEPRRHVLRWLSFIT